MGKQIIDFISDFVSISGNSTVDGIIFTIIGLSSFFIAFGFVGLFFDAIGIYDSDIMSDVHWSIRVIAFVIFTYIGLKIAQLINWLFSFKWWVYVIVGGILFAILILLYYIKHRILKNKTQNAIDKEQKNEVAVESEEKIKPRITARNKNKYCCPRCHSKLVKRHGPYGDFYGCESFNKTGCRYTRKFL